MLVRLVAFAYSVWKHGFFREFKSKEDKANGDFYLRVEDDNFKMDVYFPVILYWPMNVGEVRKFVEGHRSLFFGRKCLGVALDGKCSDFDKPVIIDQWRSVYDRL